MSIYRSYDRNGLKQAATFWSLRVLVILVVVTAMLYLIAVVPGAPYHVRELFGSSPSLPQALLFALVVMFALGPPAMLGLQLVRLPGRYAWLFPLGILVHAIIVFLGFRFATPIASVNDLLGEPVWGIGDEAGAVDPFHWLVPDGVPTHFRRYRAAVRHHACVCAAARALVVGISAAVSRAELLDRDRQRRDRQHCRAPARGSTPLGLGGVCPLAALVWRLPLPCWQSASPTFSAARRRRCSRCWFSYRCPMACCSSHLSKTSPGLNPACRRWTFC